MKLYLSSYGLGDEVEKLTSLVPNKKIGYIPNALDFSGANKERRKKHIEKDMNSLRELGLVVDLIDLRKYFGKKDLLKDKLKELGAIFISGGNVFVLRQTMKLSGLDQTLGEFLDSDFLYAGYSAAGCVLSQSLDVYKIVDDSTDTPYNESKEIIWDGLGFIDFAFMPHWDSDHPESSDIEKEVEFCKKNNISYKTLKDGDIIILTL